MVVSPTVFFVVAVLVTYLVAGVVKGVTGMALPTVAMGLLSLVIPPAEAAAILVIPTLVTNAWQMTNGSQLLRLGRRFATMIVGIVVGTFATIGLLTGASTAVASGVLGTVLVVYGLHGLLSRRIEIRPEFEKWLSPIMGLTSGMLAGATGISFIPTVPYLNSLRLDTKELIQSIGISAFTSALVLGLALASRGRFQAAVVGSSFLALAPALAGMYVGQHIRERLTVAVFRRWFLIALVALGGYMVLRS